MSKLLMDLETYCSWSNYCFGKWYSNSSSSDSDSLLPWDVEGPVLNLLRGFGSWRAEASCSTISPPIILSERISSCDSCIGSADVVMERKFGPLWLLQAQVLTQSQLPSAKLDLCNIILIVIMRISGVNYHFHVGQLCWNLERWSHPLLCFHRLEWLEAIEPTPQLQLGPLLPQSLLYLWEWESKRPSWTGKSQSGTVTWKPHLHISTSLEDIRLKMKYHLQFR